MCYITVIAAMWSVIASNFSGDIYMQLSILSIGTGHAKGVLHG